MGTRPSRPKSNKPGSSPLGRTGIFGGTFDPIHNGHLAAAQAALELLGLNRVVFVPAARPPHKRGRRLTAAGHRLTMVRLATRGNRRFRVSEAEIGRPAPSFTADTLECFALPKGEGRLHLLIGMDQAEMLDTWKNPERIFALAEVDVLSRPGHSVDRIPSRWRGRVRIIEIPGLDISSSRIRLMASRGRSIEYLVPKPVAAYIARHRLYRSWGQMNDRKDLTRK